jgi:nickel/cobalt exporter
MPSLVGNARRILAVLCTLYCVLGTPLAAAHPLLFKFYERTVDVRLSAKPSGQVVIDVNYQLELNQLIALVDAQVLLEQRKEEAPGNPKEYYEAFERVHAPILADRLYATLDDQALEFACLDYHYELKPRDGTIHCFFVFRATAKPPATSKHVFTFEEGAYKEEPGRVLLSLQADGSLALLTKDEPSAELKSCKPADLKIGDDERMRHASATFTVPAPSNPNTGPPPAQAEETLSVQAEVPEENAEAGSTTLLDLLFDTDRAFILLLFLAACWGAAHALTPGHGKTLVAAYLVGERGTIFHAFFLGLVTTLSHTGVVIVLAIVFRFFPNVVGGAQTLLGFIGGLLVVGMGFWLLYRRLAGQADHFHLGGSRHHHHHHGHDHDHTHADHYHDAHGHAHPTVTNSEPVGWWNLIVLGVAGGIVPCTDAIILLVAAAYRGHLDRALPLVLAFSAGLAGVLIAIGMLVVTSKRFAGSHFGESRLFRALPIVSATLVLGLGLWLCYDAVHSGAASASRP